MTTQFSQTYRRFGANFLYCQVDVSYVILKCLVKETVLPRASLSRNGYEALECNF
jgi:hypothetical protein